MATQKEIVLNELKKRPLTNIEIQQLVCTTCPHSIIRNIRSYYGYDSIESEKCIKKTKYFDSEGKEHTSFKTWVKYTWRGDKDDNE